MHELFKLFKQLATIWNLFLNLWHQTGQPVMQVSNEKDTYQIHSTHLIVPTSLRNRNTGPTKIFTQILRSASRPSRDLVSRNPLDTKR